MDDLVWLFFGARELGLLDWGRDVCVLNVQGSGLGLVVHIDGLDWSVKNLDGGGLNVGVVAESRGGQSLAGEQGARVVGSAGLSDSQVHLLVTVQAITLKKLTHRHVSVAGQRDQALLGEGQGKEGEDELLIIFIVDDDYVDIFQVYFLLFYDIVEGFQKQVPTPG